MEKSEAEQVLRTIAATWRQEVTTDQAASWLKMLVDLDYKLSIDAIGALEGVSEFLPSHSTFVQAVIREKGRNRKPGSCGLCVDGFVYTAEPLSEGYAQVVRCSCRATPEADEHVKGCTCGACHYGKRRWAEIVVGKGIAVTDSDVAERVKSGVSDLRADLERVAPSA